jgi:hypothetical protein
MLLIHGRAARVLVDMERREEESMVPRYKEREAVNGKQ